MLVVTYMVTYNPLQSSWSFPGNLITVILLGIFSWILLFWKSEKSGKIQVNRLNTEEFVLRNFHRISLETLESSMILNPCAKLESCET
jgi:hypothetical protein